MNDWVTLKDSLGLTLRPIDAWPGKMTPAYLREAGPYSAGLKDTLSMLKGELNALSAKNIVLQIAIAEKYLRLDGLPRAGAVADHPGVILAFDSKRGALRLYFDKFTKWQNNLRAITHHLNHLRLAGLYGVGEDGQQYRGWQALPPPPPTSGEVSAEEDAARFVEQYGGFEWRKILLEEVVFRSAYRQAAQKLHPDSGGDTNLMMRLNAAATLLKARHGI